MIDFVLLLWLIIFIILFVANIYLQNAIFGTIAGFWLLLLGIAIIITGVQMQQGMNIDIVGDNTTIIYTYTDLTLPYSTYSFIWGFILIAISIYITYKNVEDLI